MTTEMIILITLILLPLIMVFFGYRFSKKPPQKINYVFGYRTKRSMVSNETWIYAHKIIGLLWLYGGMILELLILILYINIKDITSNQLLILYYLPLIYMVISIVLTEIMIQ